MSPERSVTYVSERTHRVTSSRQFYKNGKKGRFGGPFFISEAKQVGAFPLGMCLNDILPSCESEHSVASRFRSACDRDNLAVTAPLPIGLQKLNSPY